MMLRGIADKIIGGRTAPQSQIGGIAGRLTGGLGGLGLGGAVGAMLQPQAPRPGQQPTAIGINPRAANGGMIYQSPSRVQPVLRAQPQPQPQPVLRVPQGGGFMNPQMRQAQQPVVRGQQPTAIGINPHAANGGMIYQSQPQVNYQSQQPQPQIAPQPMTAPQYQPAQRPDFGSLLGPVNGAPMGGVIGGVVDDMFGGGGGRSTPMVDLVNRAQANQPQGGFIADVVNRFRANQPQATGGMFDALPQILQRQQPQQSIIPQTAYNMTAQRPTPAMPSQPYRQSNLLGYYG